MGGVWAINELERHFTPKAQILGKIGYGVGFFFIDTNADGEADTDETFYDNRYLDWTPRLLRAAYNYQYAKKDPGAFAHNGKYLLQVLYDAVTDIGTDNSAMTRP